MSNLLIAGIVTAWLAIGAAWFIYWWTRDYDCTTEEIPLLIFMSLLGPFTFLIGVLIDSSFSKIVLIRKRGAK